MFELNSTPKSLQSLGQDVLLTGHPAQVGLVLPAQLLRGSVEGLLGTRDCVIEQFLLLVDDLAGLAKPLASILGRSDVFDKQVEGCDHTKLEFVD